MLRCEFVAKWLRRPGRLTPALLLATVAASVWAAHAIAEDPPFRELLSRIPAQTPTDSLGCLRVREGFRVELMCAEPLVCDPIAIDWGPDGRLWVVDMGDYPLGPGETPESRGCVKYLTDTDGDGKYDQSQLFLDKLGFPTGVMPWRDGVLITCAPDILYARDTDGNGRVDRVDVLYTGFGEGNPQHRVNALRWGLDNWIYGANGDSGGTITAASSGIQVDIHARDFRIRPDTGELQTQTGMAQYGRCRDDWGNWIGGRNLQPSWHCALEDHYLRRNPYLVPPEACIDLMDPPTCAPVYPISQELPRFNELWTLNRFTASCGQEFYRDDLFGPDFAHSYFVCEPAYNLVHRSVMHPKGTTFFSRRAPQEQTSEFLASTDIWFRPVQARTGPDGGLWVVDMYRLIIEHPEYIPERWHSQLDFLAGRGMGRIYRVLPKEAAARPIRAISRLPVPEQVRLLDSPNGPVRDQVQQLLVTRYELSARDAVRQLAATSPRAKSRLSALCTLEGLDAIDEPTLLRALDDENPNVRRHAVRLSEPWLATSTALQTRLVAMLADPDAQVRMQLAYTLGEWQDPQAAKALAKIAIGDAEDPLMMAAVMSSATWLPAELLTEVLDQGSPRGAQVALIENLLRLVLEAEEEPALALGLRRLAQSDNDRFAMWQYQVMASLIDAIEDSGSTLQEFSLRSGPELGVALQATAPLFAAARRDMADPSGDPGLRVQAVRLVGRGLDPSDNDVSLLAAQLVATTPYQVQREVVQVLGILRPADLPRLLLEGWSQHSPEIRPQILDVLLRHEDWTVALLDAIAEGSVAANEIGAVNRSRLILHSSANVRRRAAEVLQVATPAPRQAVLDRYRQLVDQPADAAHGREVFRKHCATCHQLEGEGTVIGPDLLALTDRSTDALLVAVLDPNRAVEPRFVEYSAITQAGRIYSGIISSETGNGVTILDAQGESHALLRGELDELISTGRSLMPVGAEELMNQPQDLLDLLAYLRTQL